MDSCQQALSGKSRILTKYLSVVSLTAALVVLIRCLQLRKGPTPAPGEDGMAPHWSKSSLWSENGVASINPHPFKYLINQPSLCADRDRVDLLILVSSAVAHWDRRDAIRATWGSHGQLRSFQSRLVFLLGQGRDRQSAVEEEARQNLDIIQEDFFDVYHNLTLKTVMGLKWSAIFCPQAGHVLKTDDDVFVNIPLLHRNLLQGQPRPPAGGQIVGCIKNGPDSPQPIAMGDNEGRMRPGHPYFTAGAGYLLPGWRTHDLYLASLSTRLIPVEDAFTTGYCALKVGLHPPRHDHRFSCGQLVPDDCDMAHRFTGHKVSADRQFTMFEKLSSGLCHAR